MAIDSTTCAALLQFDGNLTDATAKTTWVNNNGATFDSGAAKFGSCLFLNGSYLTSGYTTGLDLLSAGAFVIEGWIRPNSTSYTSRRLFSTGGGGVAWNYSNGIHVLLQQNYNQLNFLFAQNGSGFGVTADAVITVNTWNHFVVQYDPTGSGILHIGINGSLQAWAVGQPNRPSNNPTAAIGTIPGETGYTYTGHIDSFRVSSGTTGDYSGPTYVVPTAPYSLAPPDPNAPQKTTLTLSLNSTFFSNPGNVYTIAGQYATVGTNNTANF